MQHHTISRRILRLEARTADLMVRLALVGPAGGRDQLTQTRRELDSVLLEVREAHGVRAHLLETLGMPPVLGWISRDRSGTVAIREQHTHIQ